MWTDEEVLPSWQRAATDTHGGACFATEQELAPFMYTTYAANEQPPESYLQLEIARDGIGTEGVHTVGKCSGTSRAAVTSTASSQR